MASGYVYIQSEPQLWTVGFYRPDGRWLPESDHDSKDEAAQRVIALNGGCPDGELVEQLLANAGEEWGASEGAACTIAVGYIRHLEAAALNQPGCEDLRDLIAEILDEFSPASGDGHRARVGQVRIARWRSRAGLTDRK
jgi:hypothetical protein